VTAILAYLSLFVVVMVGLQYALGSATGRLFAWRG
jgi:hypothetical protein